MNEDKYIDRIVSRIPCKRHNKQVNDPCFKVYPISGIIPNWGICDSRARAAGHNGKIQASSRNGRA